MNYLLWKTTSGKILKISEMSTEHILNCIKMIERSKHVVNIDLNEEPREEYVVNYNEYKPYLKVFKEELEKR